MADPVNPVGGNVGPAWIGFTPINFGSGRFEGLVNPLSSLSHHYWVAFVMWHGALSARGPLLSGRALSMGWFALSGTMLGWISWVK